MLPTQDISQVEIKTEADLQKNAETKAAIRTREKLRDSKLSAELTINKDIPGFPKEDSQISGQDAAKAVVDCAS